MVQVSTVARVLVRIVLGYGAACLAVALLMVAIGAVMSIGQPLTDGRSAFEDFTNQVGWAPLYVVAAGLFAAPVAVLGIIRFGGGQDR